MAGDGKFCDIRAAYQHKENVFAPEHFVAFVEHTEIKATVVAPHADLKSTFAQRADTKSYRAGHSVHRFAQHILETKNWIVFLHF